MFLNNVNTQEPFWETKIWEKSLFKNNSECQTFDEMFYCGMIRLRNTNLDVFTKCSVHKNYFKKGKLWDRVRLRNIQNFWYLIKLSTVTWPNADTNNRKFSENIFTERKKTVRDKINLENVQGATVSVKYFNAS